MPASQHRAAPAVGASGPGVRAVAGEAGAAGAAGEGAWQPPVGAGTVVDAGFAEMLFGAPEPAVAAAAGGVAEARAAAVVFRAELARLVPSYVAARDALDAGRIAVVGAQLIEAHAGVHAARRALGLLAARGPQQSRAGASAGAHLAAAAAQVDGDAERRVLDAEVAALDALVASVVTPGTLRGSAVAGEAVAVGGAVVEGGPGAREAALRYEVVRTAELADAARAIRAAVGDAAAHDAARRRIASFAGRPVDLAFLRAAVGPAWAVLDATAGGTELAARPSDLLADAQARVADTGWLGDAGRFELDEAVRELGSGTRASAEVVVSRLMSADAATRGMLLGQLQARGVLGPLCGALGWAEVKALHDSLGPGAAGVKSELQTHFLDRDVPGAPVLQRQVRDKRGFGPALDEPWTRAPSLQRTLAGSGVGDALNTILDITTGGFAGSYSRAHDAHDTGQLTAAESDRAQAHAALGTALVAAASMLVGAGAERLVRGTSSVVSTTRGYAASTAGGAAGGVAGLATSDAYGLASGDRDGFSSVEDYLLSAILGGSLGALFHGAGRVGQHRPQPSATSTPHAAAQPAVAASARPPRAPVTPETVPETVAEIRASKNFTEAPGRLDGVAHEARARKGDGSRGELEVYRRELASGSRVELADEVQNQVLASNKTQKNFDCYIDGRPTEIKSRTEPLQSGGVHNDRYLRDQIKTANTQFRDSSDIPIQGDLIIRLRGDAQLPLDLIVSQVQRSFHAEAASCLRQVSVFREDHLLARWTRQPRGDVTMTYRAPEGTP